MNPVVSVVLPVYNCPRYVGQAIDCVLAQTFTDFELIVIDDGSTDETPSVLKRYTDPRVRHMAQANRGLAGTLNRGIDLARGRYVARQDQDDVSFPERFAKQVAFLDAHPACAMVGTWAEIWQDDEKTGRVHGHPSDNATLKFELLLNNPFVHSSMMLRKEALEHVGGYCTDRDRQPPEDFELWSRIARDNEIANIPELLHAYREIPGSMSRLGESPFMNHLVTICTENIAWASGADPSDPQVGNIAALAHRADHRLKGDPDIASMRDIFRRAAMQVTGEESPGEFARLAEARVDSLRYRLWEMRHAHGWRGQVVRAARSMARLMRGS